MARRRAAARSRHPQGTQTVGYQRRPYIQPGCPRTTAATMTVTAPHRYSVWANATTAGSSRRARRRIGDPRCNHPTRGASSPIAARSRRRSHSRHTEPARPCRARRNGRTDRRRKADWGAAIARRERNYWRGRAQACRSRPELSPSLCSTASKRAASSTLPTDRNASTMMSSSTGVTMRCRRSKSTLSSRSRSGSGACSGGTTVGTIAPGDARQVEVRSGCGRYRRRSNHGCQRASVPRRCRQGSSSSRQANACATSNTCGEPNHSVSVRR